MTLRIGSLLVVAMCAPAVAQVTHRVNLSTDGEQANAHTLGTSISADGRYVVFSTPASTLVPGDTNLRHDVFVRDRRHGTTQRVSVGPGGIEGNHVSTDASLSADGRFVCFTSYASNLVGGDSNGDPDVFLHDRFQGSTELVSISPTGLVGNDNSADATISDDGRFVAFVSHASNLVSGSPSIVPQVFLRDRWTSSTELISSAPGAADPDGEANDAAISGNGRFVAFVSGATNLVASDTNGFHDIFVRDRFAGITERVSLGLGGAQANDGSYYPAISPDGRYVGFVSLATNLVPGDVNGVSDVFLRDRWLGTTEIVSVSTGGAAADARCDDWASLSGDGRFVAFGSEASNLVAGDTNGTWDVFLRDRLTGTTERVGLGHAGQEGSSGGGVPCMSRTGRFVAFSSQSVDLVPDDTNGFLDVFVRDRIGGTDFTSLCDPGSGGVIGCPCSNPPSATGRGCDNSAGTGGAVLSASGGAFLSSDSLVFAASGQMPGELSIVTQWSGASAAGATYGMGVRCTSGSPKRLYTKNALAGSVTAPDFGAGELQVSRRSAALGDAILLGQSRWYLVYYRDPIVLGGCPAGSTFNATQTGRVVWSP